MMNTARNKILFMPEGSILAHVGRTLAVADALDHDRFEVAFAAEGRHAHWISEAGYALRPVYTRDRNALIARLREGGSAFDVDTLCEYVNDELTVLGDSNPDVVVGDFRPSLSVSSQVAKTPYVSITNAIWTKYINFRLDPPQSWRATRVLGKPILRALTSVLEKPVFAHYAKPFNTVRRSYGLSRVDDIRDCMCSEDLTLMPDVPEFFPTADLPACFRYVGPITWNPENSLPEWWGQLDTSETRRKIIYVTMGSTGPQERVGEIVLGLASAGYQVICTMTAEDCPELAEQEHCFSRPYLPGSKICEVADAVVCHAGNGTIYQALAHGTPIVGIADFHDQEFNMQRVSALGLGVLADRGKDLSGGVIHAVQDLLSESRYTEAASEFQHKISQWSGAQRAASSIGCMFGIKETAA